MGTFDWYEEKAEKRRYYKLGDRLMSLCVTGNCIHMIETWDEGRWVIDKRISAPTKEETWKMYHSVCREKEARGWVET